MAEYIDKSEIYRRYFNGGCGVVRMHVSDIDIIPAADVAPVVHGRWKYHKYVEKYECTECDILLSPVQTETIARTAVQRWIWSRSKTWNLSTGFVRRW